MMKHLRNIIPRYANYASSRNSGATPSWITNIHRQIKVSYLGCEEKFDKDLGQMTSETQFDSLFVKKEGEKSLDSVPYEPITVRASVRFREDRPSS